MAGTGAPLSATGRRRSPGAGNRRRGRRLQLVTAEIATTEREDDVQWAAELLRRRAVDAALFDELAQEGFEGKAYDRFEEALAGYGVALVEAWIKSGTMFAMCLRHGFPIGPRPAGLQQEDIESLASATVEKALQKFRADALEGTGWRPDGGASLTTYFVTTCIFAFLNPYKKWRRQQARLPWSDCVRVDEPDEADFCAPAHDNPEARAVNKMEVMRLLRALRSDRERLIVKFTSEGYSPAEIAELLGGVVQPAAIRAALRRLQDRMSKIYLSVPEQGTGTDGREAGS